MGVLGFIPGVTTHYHSMGFAGHGSHAELLGLFQTSTLHNVVHLLYGLAGLSLARTVDGARGFLIAGGLIYLVLWIYGLAIDQDAGANFVPLNTADTWLHFVLGLVMVGIGVGLEPLRRPTRSSPR